jgi:hypothetical protein
MIRWLVLAGWVAGIAGIAGSGACGDNLAPPVLHDLAALPGVHDVTEQPTQDPGYHYYVLHFTQPVDHADPTGPTFLQEVSLLHRDTAAPMVVHTSGYWDYYLDSEVELTQLLGANQISIEHRFFAGSRPDPADWTKLTIEQMADDEHAIVTALQQVYSGAFISTGGSKGGMTAIFYRRFFPDDVAGTVPYVAPISFGVPDARYVPFLASVGTPDCHQLTKDLAVEMLSHRRAALEAAAQTQAATKGYTYTRVALPAAVESAVISFEWSFWQYFGVTQCGMLPAVTASDADLFKVLDTVSAPSESDDEQVGLFDAYYFQAYYQLGYPADGTIDYLGPFELYSDADYNGSLPTAMPDYDGGAAMTDIADFVANQGDRFMFVYGQWDPWTGGEIPLGNATDSLELVQDQGTHNSHLTQLAAADQQAAFAKLAAWTGVTPKVPRIAFTTSAAPAVREPHVPPAIRRALRGARASH